MSGGVRHVEAYALRGIGTSAGIRFKSARIRGGVVEDVTIHDVELENVRTAIAADLNWFPQFSYPRMPEGESSIPAVWKILTMAVPADQALPHFRRIKISDVRAKGSETGIRVMGIAEAPIEDVVLRRVRIEAQRAGSVENAKNWKLEEVSIRGRNSEEVTIR
jgi:polygalacturonase